ncbi:MAG: phosphoglucosamine mutase [Syntrophobacterales bacterium]|nr:phosphoglucosamine mutase [Syntrophobacterales bacterium]
MGILFGTDGIRGVANTYPITAEVAMKVGSAVASVLRSNTHRPKILIGKDTRLSGYMLEYAMTSGICAMGVDVFLVGPLPTPGIAFITRDMRADAGIVISASHNPYEYNGIKIFARDGYKLPDEIELKLEEIVFNFNEISLAPCDRIGRARRIEDVQGRYIVFLKHTFPPDLSLEGLKLVVDCAHGAAYKVAPLVFQELGADVIATGIQPDGRNINDRCGALYPECIAQLVRKYGAHAGIAFDGDADRVIMADEKGNVLDGDTLMAICAEHMLREDRLPGRTVVATVMSNLGLEKTLESMNARLIRTPVGDRYVVEEMKKHGYKLGGEQSGHIVFLDHNTTGDGIISALQVLAIMLKRERPLSELSLIMEKYPQKLVNIPLPDGKKFWDIPGMKEYIIGIEKRLGKEGRILVRPSGTEPVVRVMVEALKEELIEDTIEEAVSFIKKHFSP